MGTTIWYYKSRIKSNDGKPVEFKNFFLLAAAGGADSSNTQQSVVVTLGKSLHHTGLCLLMGNMWRLAKMTLSSASAPRQECICTVPAWGVRLSH